MDAVNVGNTKIDYSITGPRHYIGGSDIAAVMGISRWKSPLRLWAEITGRIPRPDLSDVEHVVIGQELEEYVSRKFAKKTGYKIRRDSRVFIHPTLPYMVGHIDRWVTGEDAIFEAKTTGAWRAKEWEGLDMPQDFILQVTQYMGILYRLGKRTENQRGYCGALIGGQKFAWKEIPFNLALFEQQEEAAKNFWENHVLADVAPLAGADDGDTLNALFPESDENTLTFEGEDGEKIDNLIEERQGGLEQLELVQQEIDSLSNQLKQFMGEASYGQTGRHQISWKLQGRTSADTEKMKADGIFEKYSRTSTFKVLRCKKLKGAIAA